MINSLEHINSELNLIRDIGIDVNLSNIEDSCENCKFINEDTNGVHCGNCTHNAYDNFRLQILDDYSKGVLDLCNRIKLTDVSDDVKNRINELSLSLIKDKLKHLL